MKYTKTALAVAIAGFAATPMMAAAETTLSGLVQVKVAGVESDDDDLQKDANFEAGDVRVAINREHELDNGLIGYGNLQMNVDDLTSEGGFGQDAAVQIPQFDQDGSLTDEDPVELSSEATVSSDNVYVGVKGGFGDVRFGEIPLAVEYGQLANDIHDVGTTVPGGASYEGTFGPVGLILNASPENDSDMFGVGAKFGFAGASIGVGWEERAEQTNLAAGASYTIAGFSLAAHFWSQGQVDFDFDEGEGATDNLALTTDLDDRTAFAVQAGYEIAGVTLGLTYSMQTTEAGTLVGADGTVFTPGDDGVIPAGVTATAGEGEEAIIRFDAGYALGGGMDISTRIQNKATDNDVGVDPDDELEYRVMLTQTF